jgi:hypothetical protein
MLDREPIKDFRDEQELNSCLEEWQRILYLDDWVIQARLIDRPSLEEMSGENLQGRNEFNIINKSSVIYVIKADDYANSTVRKYCAEKVLVHELLHCKYNWLSPPNTLEGRYFDTLEHQLLEDMAKSLILARYNITKDWFRNIG